MINEQEMQFADPDWQPAGASPASQGSGTSAPPAPVSPTYATPVPASLLPYDQGYQGVRPAPPPFIPPVPAFGRPVQAPFVRQMPYQSAAPRRRGSSRKWVILGIVLLLIVMMSSGMGMFGLALHSHYNGSGGAAPVPMQNTYSYAMQGATELDINDLSGDIVVNISDGDDASVQISSDEGQPPQVNYQGQGMTLTSDGDITVTIPQGIVLKLSGGLNSIEVDGFNGQLTAQTNSGDITLSGDDLTQGSSVNTSSGNIDQEMGSAESTSFTSSTGTIMLNQVDLSGQTTVSTGGEGTITYTGGTLDPHGKFQFTTDSGFISLTLPADTALHMTVSQKSGQFNSDFPPGAGTASQAEVGITTQSGDITISKE